MRLCYFIQNHLAPSQVARLVRTLRRTRPDAFILVCHDELAGYAAVEEVRRAVDADVFTAREPARRGDYSLIQPYFDALEWLAARGVAYDWIVYLSGQDYPTQPLRRLEERLATGGYDGYLRFWDVRDAENPWGRRHQGIRRYFYQYTEAPAWTAPALRLLKALNGVQSWIHVQMTYGPRIGLRRRPPFGPELTVYTGKAWTILSRACAEHVAESGRSQGELVRWFQRTLVPDEAVVQTLLVNSGRFRLCNDDLRYMDFTGSRDGRPRTLTERDLPVLTGGEYYFARKFERDSRVLDLLDERIG
ncbi:MAG TPA: beta-1,6-N-acetylglucosaminyltransferase [Thermoanaerobaculia bacterium]|nr:beta-1,6-N-acetylglucosaminyltransferase [Thermoanaerobaculia bacterium]